jgi:IS30 family transposase
LLIHVERKSLFTTISKLHRATAKAAQRATVRRLKPLHRNVRTITYDNGEEFAAPERTARSLNTRIFFATPYHAWERGMNENTNGLIRDFFPKGTDFTGIHPATVAIPKYSDASSIVKSLFLVSPQTKEPPLP